MRIKTTVLIFFLFLPAVSLAETMHHADEHPSVFHAFKLETDIGGGQEGTVGSWDFDGWIGTDYNKLWLRAEGEDTDGTTHQSEFWAMYSRNIATFWDAQLGIRQDTEPTATTYLVAGFEGVAPYFFETQAHIFVSDQGNISARIREENDFFLTQRLITQPYAEINFSAQDVPEAEIGSGVSSVEIGLQTRYEFSRKYAPYIDVRYERKLGETASIARNDGERQEDIIMAAGVRLLF